MSLGHLTQQAALKAQRQRPAPGTKPAAQTTMGYNDLRFTSALRDSKQTADALLAKLKTRCGD